MDALLAPMATAEHHEVGGVRADVMPAGEGRVKRVVYPAGFRWSQHMQPVTGGTHCAHAHLGFLARGKLAGEYADGCTWEFATPTVVTIAPGHDGWVVGDEDAVLIEFDFLGDTAARCGLPTRHEH